MVSNRLAADAPSWAELFATYNSGTYTNQWVIVDYKNFSPGKVLPPNTVWLLESIPGFATRLVSVFCTSRLTGCV